MLKSLFASALFAGVAAGLLAALLQLSLLVPLIVEAELYETGAKTHFAGTGEGAAAGADGHAHDHAGAAGEAGGGLLRHAQTAMFTVLTMCGFGLLLAAGFALAERAGLDRITLGKGALWGLGGFAALQLLPAIGLAPELPGASAAGLGARQLWWLFAVAGSVAGLAALFYAPGAWRLAGVALIALPHLVGAPHPEMLEGVAPPELSALFASRALGVGAAAWLALGAAAGWLWSRQRAGV